jgi:hypothetical protein
LSPRPATKARPGVNVSVAAPPDRHVSASGTSYAAPIVAALIARGMPKRDAFAAARMLADLSRRARDLGAPGRDAVYGYGLLTPDALP